MVDKIDKPEAPSPYRVEATTQSKEDKQKEENRQEDLPTFKKQESTLYREKFQSEMQPAQTFKVPLEHIKELVFRRALPRHGVPTVEADLIWSDGKKTEGISFLLKRWQDFMLLKNLKPGTAIPNQFWGTPPDLEVTVRPLTPSGLWHLKTLEETSSKTTKLEKETKSVQLFKKLKWMNEQGEWVPQSIILTSLLFLGFLGALLLLITGR